MPEQKSSNMVPFSIKAARSSWQLAVLTIILAILSKHIGRAAAIAELIALLAIIASIVCGVIGLSGMARHGSKNALFPSLIGVIISGFLLLIFVTSAISEYKRSTNLPRPAVVSTKHLGTWEAQTPKGQHIRWIFSQRRLDISYENGPAFPAYYTMDYSKSPIWLTCVMYKKDGSSDTMPLIIEFTGPDTMRVLGPFGNSNERPTGFSGAEKGILEFKKQYVK